MTLDPKAIEHLRFAGARLLLSVFRDTGIPVDVEERHRRLQPTVRALWYSAERGGRSLYEVAAEVRLIGEALAGREAAPTKIPEDIAEVIGKSGPGGHPAVLLETADHLEVWSSGYVSKLAGAVPTSEEIGHRFPRLMSMLDNYFGQDGIATEDDLTDVEGLRLYISEQHLHLLCPWALPPVVGECAEALALFHDDGSLARFFCTEHGLGSGTLSSWTEWLSLISRTLAEHMREHHPPVWTAR